MFLYSIFIHTNLSIVQVFHSCNLSEWCVCVCVCLRHGIASYHIQIKYKYLLFIECVDFMESFDNSFHPFHPKQIFICFFFFSLFLLPYSLGSRFASYSFSLSLSPYHFSFKPFFPYFIRLCFAARSVGNFLQNGKDKWKRW